ncbi:hypothetical protein KCU83_g203, partial [Aureobasidium melanogenum]
MPNSSALVATIPTRHDPCHDLRFVKLLPKRHLCQKSEGEPSKSVSLTCSTPKMVFICSSGFATVAEQEMNLIWRLPTAAHILRKRLMIRATCAPKSPLSRQLGLVVRPCTVASLSDCAAGLEQEPLWERCICALTRVCDNSKFRSP